MKRKKEIFIALALILFMLFGGTLFYHHAEGWNYIDSFYFTGITLLTIGYGDLHPSMPFTKIITVIAGFMSIGLVLYSATLIVRSERDYVEKKFKKMYNYKKKSK